MWLCLRASGGNDRPFGLMKGFGRLSAGCVKEIVKDQHYAIKAVHDQIKQMQGRSGNRIVVRLFNEDSVADAAVSALNGSGLQ